MPFGLTPTGFVRKTLEDLLSEIEADEKSLIDARLDTSADTPIGQLNGIMAGKLAELWEVADEAVAGGDPDAATGFQLDQVSSITGTTRQAATKGTVSLDLSLDATTTVPLGSIVQVVDDPTNRWVTTAEADNPAGVPAVISVEAEAEVAGAVGANAATITVIVTPVTGWTAVTNPLAAEPGENDETDTELRNKRQTELALGGTSPVNAIRADLLQVEGVTEVAVFENNTDVTDVEGVPPHSVECLVLGGDDVDIANQILNSVAAGIGTHGAVSENVTDSQGFGHTIKFSRPTVVNLDIEVDVTTDGDYPATGDTLVETAVTDFTVALPVGKDANRFELGGAALTVTGVLNVTDVRIEETPTPPVSADYVITSREIAGVASVVVLSTPGTP